MPRVRTTTAPVIYLIRHGQSESNAAGLLVGRSNPALTELGREQARRLRPLLDGVVEVWVSPLSRAFETAREALPHLEPTVVDDLIEVDYGSLEGRPMATLTEDEWQDIEGDHASPIGGGESLADVDARVHPLLRTLLADRSSLLHDPERHLAIVSHVSPIKSVLTWAMDVPGRAVWHMRIDNCSLSVVGPRRNGATVIRTNLVP